MCKKNTELLVDKLSKEKARLNNEKEVEIHEKLKLEDFIMKISKENKIMNEEKERYKREITNLTKVML